MVWKGWENFAPKEGQHSDTPPDETRPRSKYRAVKVVVDGQTFDSKREAARWRVLVHEQQIGLISELQRQVPFDLTAIARETGAAGTRGFQKIGEYRADFTYVRDGVYVVEDSKGYRTDLYRWKKKHFQIEYNRKILET